LTSLYIVWLSQRQVFSNITLHVYSYHLSETSRNPPLSVTNSIGCSRWIEGITSLLSDGCIKSYDEYLSCCYSWGEVTGKIRRKISV
jgi:hypothetical protein